MKQPVLKILIEQMIKERVQLFEYREEKEPLQRDHRYGNDTRKRRFVVREDLRRFAHLCDLRASRAKIFSVLHKKKTAVEKRLRNIAVWWVYFSEHKCKKLNAERLTLKAFIIVNCQLLGQCHQPPI
jgi:hypothetical protein